MNEQKRNEEWNLFETPSELLYPIKFIVESELYGDSFPRYIKSEICYKAILEFINDESVISRSVKEHKIFFLINLKSHILSFCLNFKIHFIKKLLRMMIN